jgi:hypothetical protein
MLEFLLYVIILLLILIILLLYVIAGNSFDPDKTQHEWRISANKVFSILEISGIVIVYLGLFALVLYGLYLLSIKFN